MNRIEKYLKFILLKAVRLSDGDNLVIWCSKHQSNFANAVSGYANKIGADNVEIYFTDLPSNSKVLSDSVIYWKSNNYKLLWVYSDSCTDFPPLSWTTVNVATESWAKQVFPEITDIKTAVNKLWDVIFTACRIDENDPVDNWNSHIEALKDKADKLNSFNFNKLHIKNRLGTDLSVSLIKNHKWINCTFQNHSGETVITNIPTEEVFTAPDFNGVNGIVYASKPLLYKDEKIENFYLKFEKGKIVDFGAEKNAHLLQQLLNCCKNSNRIGEIAIVPHSSPISQLDIFCYDTSFDENAGCHIALGAAYPQTVNNFSEQSKDDLTKLGFNICDIHEDFVIGTSDIEIIGITPDNQTITVMKNGEWII